MHTITPDNLKEIIGYQKKCEGKPIVTTRAAFRIEALEELIAAIKNSIEYKEYEKEKSENPSRNTCYHLCLTFVREDANKITEVTPNVYVKDYSGEIKKIGLNLCNGYTQLIPVFTGCVWELEDIDNYRTKKFSYLRKDKVIPFVAPGGEGSGLIPPPPTGGDDLH